MSNDAAEVSIDRADAAYQAGPNKDWFSATAIWEPYLFLKEDG